MPGSHPNRESWYRVCPCHWNPRAVGMYVNHMAVGILRQDEAFYNLMVDLAQLFPTKETP